MGAKPSTQLPCRKSEGLLVTFEARASEIGCRSHPRPFNRVDIFATMPATLRGLFSAYLE